MLIVVVRRIIDADGSLGAALDRILGRGKAAGTGPRWASRAGR